MPGPSTESINDDVKVLREDLHKVETSLQDVIHKSEAYLKESIHKVELDVRELSVQVRGLLASIRLLAVLTVSGLAWAIWSGATLTADVKNLGGRMDDRFKALDVRLERIESAIVRPIETPKPSAK